MPRKLTLPLLAGKPFDSLYAWQWLPQPPLVLVQAEATAAAAAEASAAALSPPSSDEVASLTFLSH